MTDAVAESMRGLSVERGLSRALTTLSKPNRLSPNTGEMIATVEDDVVGQRSLAERNDTSTLPVSKCATGSRAPPLRLSPSLFSLKRRSLENAVHLLRRVSSRATPSVTRSTIRPRLRCHLCLGIVVGRRRGQQPLTGAGSLVLLTSHTPPSSSLSPATTELLFGFGME
jgi:hypothetical protein